MSAIKRTKILYNSSAAGNGSWVSLDNRYDQSPTRSLIISLVSGDTITLQAITQDVKGNDKSFLDSLSSADIVSLKTYTASESDVLEGPWTYIRVVKTGTNGVAKVQGFI